jgi:CelD/BcsL family acetyltransferase involved in cellulose biosynthesis
VNETVTALRAAADAEWDATWSGSPYATYFQSRPWAELWRDYTGGATAPAPRWVEFSDGRTALLPLSEQVAGMGLVRTAISSPGGTGGGWLSRDVLGERHVELLTSILTRHTDLRWRVNAFDPAQAALELPHSEPQTTRALPLCEDFDAVFRRASKGHRSAVKQAEREGVSLRLAFDPKDWREYFEVYQESLARWGDRASSNYTWPLFARLSEQPRDDVKLWIAEVEGQFAAGAVCLYAPRHVVYWHGAARAEFFSRRPVQPMIFQAIRHACETGREWFDFNPSGGNQGVDDFKRHFGTVELAAPVLKTASQRARCLAWLRGTRSDVVGAG